MALNTPFKDAVESQVPRGSANNVPAPSAGQSPIEDSPFKDAVEKQVPNTRSGGLLPEKQMDDGFTHSTPKYPEPGKTFKIG